MCYAAVSSMPPGFTGRLVGSGGSGRVGSMQKKSAGGGSRRALAQVADGLLLLALLAGCDDSSNAAQQQGALPPPPQVTVAKPLVREVVEDDEFIGRFEAVDEVDIRARVEIGRAHV